jgi:hypothetical protein
MDVVVNVLVAVVLALLDQFFGSANRLQAPESQWPVDSPRRASHFEREEPELAEADIAPRVHEPGWGETRVNTRVVPGPRLRGLDQSALAREAEDAVANRNHELACQVKNAYRNLSSPGSKRWLEREVLRRIAPLRAELDALCPVLDPMQLPMSVRARGTP